MSEPVDYLSEETYRPEWLKDGVTEQTLEAVVKQKPTLVKLGRELAKYKRFYMVGSGGSYSVQLPLEYIAEKYTKVPVHAYSGWMFLEQQPEAGQRDPGVEQGVAAGAGRDRRRDGGERDRPGEAVQHRDAEQEERRRETLDEVVVR